MLFRSKIHPELNKLKESLFPTRSTICGTAVDGGGGGGGGATEERLRDLPSAEEDSGAWESEGTVQNDQPRMSNKKDRDKTYPSTWAL